MDKLIITPKKEENKGTLTSCTFSTVHNELESKD